MELSYTKTDMPRQKVGRAIKSTAKWKHECVDAVIATTKLRDSKRRRSVAERKRNYELFNNKIDPQHFSHITNPFSTGTEGTNTFKLPATLQPYDVIFPIFNVLFGEEHRRFFNPMVRVVNDQAISDKQEQEKSAILQALQEYLLQNVQQDPNNPAPPPEEVIRNAQASIKDMREETATLFLSYYKKKSRLKDEFAKGWKDWLIVGEEFFRIDQVANEVNFKRVNPLQIYFVLPENTDDIQDAVQILEENYMTLNEVIDEFYEHLTPSQIDELESYYEDSFDSKEFLTPLTIPTVTSIYEFQNEENAYDKIPVYRVRWKSFRKFGIFYYIDPMTGVEESMIVDESWMWDKEDPTQRIEWFWANEAWEGIRIGADMYIESLIRRRPQQFRSMDNLSKCKLGYVGRLCSAINSQSTSLMDRLTPWLYLYFVVWYDTELALSTNIGKVGLLDVSLVPDGWEIDKWLYYVRAMRIGFINSMNEGNKRMGINQNASTQNKELNLEMGNYIQFNIQLLETIERKIQNTAGVPPQRLGAIENRELVGNVERSITQSSLITEDLFRMHTLTKLDSCSAILEVAKDVYRSGSKALQYVTDDLQTIMFQIDGQEFSNADYGTFTTDDNKDMQVFDALRANAQAALQNDQMAFYQLADIYTSESVAQIRTELKNYYVDKQQQLSQQQEQQVQVQREQIAAQQQAHEEQMALKQYEIDTNNATKIQVAQISVFARQQDIDLDKDGIADPIELAAQALAEREASSKNFIETLKVQADKVKAAREQTLKSRELDIKEKEITAKLEAEEIKAKTALKVARTNKNKYDK